MPRSAARRLIAKARRLFRRSRVRSVARPAATRRPRRKPTTGMLIEGLEQRSFMSASVATPLSDLQIDPNSADTTIPMSGVFTDTALTGTVVRYVTNLGSFNVHLYDSVTPLTVANFLQYVDDGDYVNTIIHRSISQFVIQGGGFRRGLPPTAIPTNAAVQNEYNVSNTRGTIAMAKLPDLPNSATSQWFFNLGNNTSLNTQNGGFTVFGNVLGSGMDVVDAIAALPTVSFATNNPSLSAFTDVPLTNYTSGNNPTLANLVNISSISRINAASATGVVSSNTNLVTARIENGSLILHYLPHQSGTASITVTGTSADGSTTTDSFSVTVDPDPNYVPPVTFSGTGVNTVNYTEGDGTVVTMKFVGVTGTLEFYGPNTVVTTTGSTTTVTGDNVQLLTLDVSAAQTTKSSITITPKGGTDGGIATIGTISGTVAVAKLVAPSVNISQGINFTDSGYIGALDVRDLLNGADIALGGGAPFPPYTGVSINFDSATDGTNITATQNIRSLTANKIGAGTITSPYVGAIAVKADAKRQLDGSFGASLALSGTGAPPVGAITSMSIGGAVTGGTWTVGAGAGKIAVGSVAPSWSATFAYNIASFATTVGALAGSLTATRIDSLVVKTNLDNAKILLSGAFVVDSKTKQLGKLTVGGNITGSVIVGNSHFGAITAKTMTNSYLYTGVSSVDLSNPPESVTAFGNATTVVSFTLTGTTPGAFSNSFLGASQFAKIALKNIDTTNDGNPFGVTADIIGSISGTVNKPFTLTKLDDPAALTPKLTGLTLGDFAINLL